MLLHNLEMNYLDRLLQYIWALSSEGDFQPSFLAPDSANYELANRVLYQNVG